MSRTRTRQPQWRPQIDWSNPITRGLVFATADGKYDSVTKRILTPLNNPGVRPTRAGLFGAYKSASSQYRTLPFSSSALSEFSFFSLASFDDTSTQRSIITLSELSTTNRLVLFIGQTANRVSLNIVDSNGGSITATGTSAIAAGKIYTLGGTYKFSSGLEVFVNGKLEGTGGASAFGFAALSTIGLAARYNGSWGSFGNGAYAGQCIWGRKLSAGEFQALNSNPWQIFKGRRNFMPAIAAVQAPRTVATSLNAAIQTARTVSSSLSATVRQANAATASLSAQIVASGSMSVSAQLSAAIRQGNSANAALSAAVSQARSAVASITGAVQQPRSASASASAAIRQAKSAAANLNSAIQSAKTASASISAYVDTITRNTATASINAIVRQVASVSCSLSAIVDYESLPGGGSKKLRKKRVFIDGQEYFLNPIEAVNLLINQAEQAQESAEEAPESPDEPECSSVVSAIDYAENKASRVMASDVFVARMNAEIQRMRALAIQRQLDEEDDIECLLLLT